MKTKLATSQEIYNRVLWDPRLDRTAFVMGYADRVAPSGIREKMLSEWDPNGDIPWHRVQYVRCSQVKVWDRENRIDLFATDELPAEAWVGTIPKPPAGPEPLSSSGIVLAEGATYGWNPKTGWTPLANPALPLVVEGLRIVSYNILADRFQQDWLRTEERTAALLTLLESQTADIICLQEATPTVWQQLLAEPWVQGWFLSEPADGGTLEPYGLALLSRYPFVNRTHRLTAHKRVLLASWALNGRTLNLAVFHPPNGSQPPVVEARKQHFQAALTQIKHQPGDWFLLGDFNVRGETEFEPLVRHGLRDVWKWLRPGERGDTFEPDENALAGRLSRTGQSARFDRMWLHSPQDDWKPATIDLIGTEPVDRGERLFPSDHWGLRADLVSELVIPAEVKAAKPVFTTALILEIPAEKSSQIQSIRALYDAKATRWMPHITLLFGFFPESLFESGVKVLRYLLAHFQPFSLTLDGYRTFEHGKSVTAWLVPQADPPAALVNLQGLLAAAFPAVQTRPDRGFTPHLTVGQFPDSETALKTLPQLRPITFDIKSVALISRSQTGPFRVLHRVPLGPDQPPPTRLESLVDALHPVLSLAERETRATVLELVAQAGAEILGQPAHLVPIGSELLGIAGSGSDLDRICVIPAEVNQEAFFAAVQQRLAGICEWSRFVSATKVPALRMSIEGIPVDLLCVASPVFPFDSECFSEKDRFHFTTTDWLVLAGFLEAEFIRRTVTTRFPWETFQKLARAVRAWAKTRLLWGNAWGFPGGISWAILAAWTLEQLPAGTILATETLLGNFFLNLANHDWTHPIGLSPLAAQFELVPERDRLPVLTSIAPFQNTARNVTKSTFAHLQAEFERAAGFFAPPIVESVDWENLFAPVGLPLHADGLAVLTVSGSQPGHLKWGASWLEGHVAGTLLDLEQQGKLTVLPRAKLQITVTAVSARLYLFGNLDGIETRLASLEKDLARQLETEKPTDWSLKFKLQLI